MPQDCYRVIEKLGERFERVEPEIDGLFAAHRNYLRATGDAQYFVRAIHALGRELIERGGDNLHARLKRHKRSRAKVSTGSPTIAIFGRFGAMPLLQTMPLTPPN